ncbi:MAG: glycosyltransferase [Ruminococcaceae bacterium]|nr:glycosyltransferase [Oscillospiraceae bacterium]
MKISLCIPMYNEASIIENTARTLSSYMESNFSDVGYEVIFSDDGSTDGSADIVNSLALPHVRTVGYPDNRGKGCAVRNAVLSSEGDIVMFTDADLAYGTAVVKSMTEAFDKHPEAHVAIGSRNLSSDGYEGYTAIRKLASKMYIKVLGIVGGFKLSDSQCGCKAYRSDAAKDIFSECKVNGFAFDFETILRAQKSGYHIIEVPVKIVNHGESKINVFRDTFKMLRDLMKIKKDIKKEQ